LIAVSAASIAEFHQDDQWLHDDHTSVGSVKQGEVLD
jgi:hypothetical protein